MNLEEALAFFPIDYDADTETRRSVFAEKADALRLALDAAVDDETKQTCENDLADMDQAIMIIDMLAPAPRPIEKSEPVTPEPEADNTGYEDAEEQAARPFAELEEEPGAETTVVHAEIAKAVTQKAEQSKDPLVTATTRRMGSDNKTKSKTQSGKRTAGKPGPRVKNTDDAPGKKKLLIAAALAFVLVAGSYWFYQDYQFKREQKRQALAAQITQAEEQLQGFASKVDGLVAQLAAMNKESEAGDLSEKRAAYFKQRAALFANYHQWLDKKVQAHSAHALIAQAKQQQTLDVLDEGLALTAQITINPAQWQQNNEEQCVEQFSSPLLKAFMLSADDAEELVLFRNERGSREAIAAMSEQLDASIEAASNSQALAALEIEQQLALFESADNKTYQEMGVLSLLQESEKQELERKAAIKQHTIDQLSAALAAMAETEQLQQKDTAELVAILEDEQNQTYQRLALFERLRANAMQTKQWRSQVQTHVCQELKTAINAVALSDLNEEDLRAVNNDENNQQHQQRALYLRLSNDTEQAAAWQEQLRVALLEKVQQRLSQEMLASQLDAQDETTVQKMLDAEPGKWHDDTTEYITLGGDKEQVNQWQQAMRQSLAGKITARLSYLGEQSALAELSESALAAALHDKNDQRFIDMHKLSAYAGSDEQQKKWQAAIQLAIADKIEQRLPFDPRATNFAAVTIQDINSALQAGVYEDLQKHAQFTGSRVFSEEWKKALSLGVAQRFHGLSKKNQEDLVTDELDSFAETLRFYKNTGLSKTTYHKWYQSYRDTVSAVHLCQQIGTHAWDSVHSIHIDDHQQLLLTGDTDGSFGGDGLGDKDVYLIRMNKSGKQIFKKQIGSSGLDVLCGTHVDAMGNITVAGYCEGKLAGKKKGESDIFIVKMNAQGKILWQQQVGTKGRETAGGLFVDALGNMYVSGSSDNDLYAKNQGGTDAVLLKYSPEGLLLWGKQFGTKFADQCGKICVAADGSIYVSGTTEGNLFNKLVGRLGDKDLFIRKYSGEGEELWQQQIGSVGEEEVSSLICDQAGNVYMGGHTFGQLCGSKQSRESDAYLMCWQPDGKRRWAKQWGHTHSAERLHSVVMSDKQDLYVSGSTGKRAKFMRMDLNGNEQWHKTINSRAVESGKSIALSTTGDVYCVGTTDGALFRLLPNKLDVFIIKFDKDQKSYLDYQESLAALK